MRSESALALDACDEVIVAQSCDKNFSVYRDRVGSLFVKTGSREATAKAMAHVPARARDVVDAARPWRGGRAHHPRRSGASRATGLLSSRTCATASIRSVSGSRPPTRGSRFHRPAVRHVLDASALEGAGAEAARRQRDLHGRQRPLQRRRHGRRSDRSIYRRRGRARWTRNASWPTATRAEYRPRWIGARSRGWSSPAGKWTGSRKRSSFRPRRCSTNSRRAATTWRRRCSDCSSRMATERSAIIARGRCCLRSECRSPTRSVRAWGWPAAIPTGAILAWCSTTPIPAERTRCRCAAEWARNIRRRPVGRRRSPTSRRFWAKARPMRLLWCSAAMRAAPRADFGLR